MIDIAIKKDYALDDTLIVATLNEGKVKEINQLLKGRVPNIISGSEANLDDVEETGVTFHENAALKAVAAVKATGEISLADDSGLAVEALNGDPGIYSARWAEDENGNRDFYKAMDLIWDKIKDKDDHKAYFITVLALAFPDGHIDYIEGRVYGTIVYPPRGDNGFGYDPIFQPDGETRTIAEMTTDEKQNISHRSKAIKEFINKWC